MCDVVPICALFLLKRNALLSKYIYRIVSTFCVSLSLSVCVLVFVLVSTLESKETRSFSFRINLAKWKLVHFTYYCRVFCSRVFVLILGRVFFFGLFGSCGNLSGIYFGIFLFVCHRSRSVLFVWWNCKKCLSLSAYHHRNTRGRTAMKQNESERVRERSSHFLAINYGRSHILFMMPFKCWKAIR